MKKIITVFIILIILTGCQANINNPVNNASIEIIETNDTSTVELPENEILFLDYYENYAWGYSLFGKFITSNGELYVFDAADDFTNDIDFTKDDIDLRDRLILYAETHEPVEIISIDEIEKLYKFGLQIDPNSQFDSRNVAFDAGIRSVSFYNDILNKEIELSVIGDYEGETSDTYGKRLLSNLEKYFN